MQTNITQSIRQIHVENTLSRLRAEAIREANDPAKQKQLNQELNQLLKVANRLP